MKEKIINIVAFIVLNALVPANIVYIIGKPEHYWRLPFLVVCICVFDYLMIKYKLGLSDTDEES